MTTAATIATGKTEVTIADADPPQGPWIVTVHHSGQRIEVEADQITDMISVLAAARDHLRSLDITTTTRRNHP